jgi:ferric-dicitrate binding protein FerR (iron transport regulator)
VRGTIFTVTDRCDGTLTTVTRGRVAVRDTRRRKTIIVRAGKRYLARAPR